MVVLASFTRPMGRKDPAEDLARSGYGTAQALVLVVALVWMPTHRAFE
ncbi:MAG: hypothetical protein IH975_12735 [Nitrospinae bacterium]|nr:hypothetical protein [Nitrospinota bacterium]